MIRSGEHDAKQDRNFYHLKTSASQRWRFRDPLRSGSSCHGAPCCADHYKKSADQRRGPGQGLKALSFVAGLSSMPSSQARIQLEGHTALCACWFPGQLAAKQLWLVAAGLDLEGDSAGPLQQTWTPHTHHRYVKQDFSLCP